jgi:hypothetical protein
MKRSPYIVYVDETGDHGLDKINPSMPVFTLCAALYAIEEYRLSECPSLAEVKLRLWRHDNVVFHSRSIRRKLRPFQALADPIKMATFVAALNAFFAASKATVVAAAIDKPKHKERYKFAENPYFLCLQFVLERVYGELKSRGAVDGETVFVFESRGLEEDRILLGWFNQTCEGANQWGRLPFRAEFASKLTNMPGLQVADLCAYPIARHVENPESINPSFDCVEPLIRRSPSGKTMGWGLKIFP